ncbi:MAG: hypothetical protein CMF72_15325 [Mameliella sp.]|nr:hypothetical protein [Mameliella sp.]|tara:strand:- start:1731 stop:2639 length:909 start_codon:yes stop_codon:yes gene_type:complete
MGIARSTVFYVFSLGVFTASAALADECPAWLTSEFHASATLEGIDDCLSSGRLLTERTDAGETPLHLAAGAARTADGIRALLRIGADITLSTEAGWTPLHSAAAQGTAPAVVSALLVYGADIEASAEPDWWCMRKHCSVTPLILASGRKDDAIDVLTTLLGAGARVDVRDQDMQTPLHHAAANRGLAEVEVLLTAGADVSAEDAAGETPLHQVARRPDADPAVVALLLQAGALVDAKKDEDTTPLILASYYVSDPAVVQILVKHSEDPCFKDDKERSALDGILYNENLEKDDLYWSLSEICK